MAGLDDPNVIDVVAETGDGVVALVMVESRGWGDDANQPEQLKAKINAYAGYVFNGALATEYPATIGNRSPSGLTANESPLATSRGSASGLRSNSCLPESSSWSTHPHDGLLVRARP